MATLRDIKNRIRSVKSTEKITKAMEMMAASKMKKAQQTALIGRPYLEKLSEVINNLVFLSDPPLQHPLLDEKPVTKRTGYILLTSNRGLCGGFNGNVIRKMYEAIKSNEDDERVIITLGRKGRQAMERMGQDIIGDFETLSDKPTFMETLGISNFFIEDFIQGKFDQVFMVYSRFNSTVSQTPVIQQLLPLKKHIEKLPENFHTEYIFEANKPVLLDRMLRRYLEISVYQTVMESLASEHSARMMAMRTASDSARDIISSLTLHYNKARQSKITTQLLEVVSGSNAQ